MAWFLENALLFADQGGDAVVVHRVFLSCFTASTIRDFVAKRMKRDVRRISEGCAACSESPPYREEGCGG
jgi:hypothetical protein